MNQLQANLVHAVSNLHVSVPVVVGATLAILPIWFPAWKAQLEATAGVLTAYGVIAAANTPASSQTPPK